MDQERNYRPVSLLQQQHTMQQQRVQVQEKKHQSDLKTQTEPDNLSTSILESDFLSSSNSYGNHLRLYQNGGNFVLNGEEKEEEEEEEHVEEEHEEEEHEEEEEQEEERQLQDLTENILMRQRHDVSKNPSIALQNHRGYNMHHLQARCLELEKLLEAEREQHKFTQVC